VIPDVSVVVVSHRTAEESIACAVSVRGEFGRSNLSGEIVLVDCDSGREEQKRLRKAEPDTLVLLSENRGYSGGINAGLARARASLLVLCNADVVFSRGSLAPLVAAGSRTGTGAAGPLCTWDSGGRIRMPPGFAPGFFRDFLQLSTGRSRRMDDRRFAAFARRTLRLWSGGGAVDNLTGAVLAVRREVFDRVGRFDERFPFEYEETEWEDRVRSRGFSLTLVPAARVRHLWGSSAAEEGETAARRRRSRHLYWRHRYGTVGLSVLERAARRSPGALPPAISQPRLPARDGAWVAVSTNPSILPFAGAPLDSDFVLPPEVGERVPAVPIYLRSFRASDGEPLETFVWRKERA
jgi:GT2 family glycosyltransferase